MKLKKTKTIRFHKHNPFPRSSLHSAALTLLTILSAVSLNAASLVVANNSFESPFAGPYSATYTGAAGTYAYGPAPGWGGEQNWGYVWNPTGTSGINHWGDNVGLVGVSDGVAAYGSWGAGGLYFGTWQNITPGNGGLTASQGDSFTLTFDLNVLSGDYAAPWASAKIQLPTGVGGYTEASWGGVGVNPGIAMDQWTPISLTFTAPAAAAGSDIQVFLQGAGVWVDNVQISVTAVPEPGICAIGVLAGLSLLARRLNSKS